MQWYQTWLLLPWVEKEWWQKEEYSIRLGIYALNVFTSNNNKSHLDRVMPMSIKAKDPLVDLQKGKLENSSPCSVRRGLTINKAQEK